MEVLKEFEASKTDATVITSYSIRNLTVVRVNPFKSATEAVTATDGLVSFPDPVYEG